MFAEPVTDAAAHLDAELEDAPALEGRGVGEIVGGTDDADISKAVAKEAAGLGEGGACEMD